MTTEHAFSGAGYRGPRTDQYRIPTCTCGWEGQRENGRGAVARCKSQWQRHAEVKVFDPATADIEFVAAPSRIVHVSVPLRPEDLQMGGVPISPFMALMLYYGRTLCGIQHRGRDWSGTATFPDENICSRCHARMGDFAFRLFDSERHERGLTESSKVDEAWLPEDVAPAAPLARGRGRL